VKECRICETEKPLDEFHLCTNSNDGRHSYCKPCANQRAARSYAKNRAKISVRQKQWYIENREKAIAAAKAYYEKQDKSVIAAKRRAKRNDG